jgi:cell division protein FtsB
MVCMTTAASAKMWATQQATNAKLKSRNDQLFAEIDDLNGGQESD